MHSSNRLAPLKRATDALLARARQSMAGGDYVTAQNIADEALRNWRAGGGPKTDEGDLIVTLGKCFEGQQKYDQAYDLYMQSLNNLTGPAYDEVYQSFLYLNERMGTFTNKSSSPEDSSDNQSGLNSDGANIPKGYYDDFNK